MNAFEMWFWRPIAEFLGSVALLGFVIVAILGIAVLVHLYTIAKVWVSSHLGKSK
jgi:hypothetical protein